MTTLLELPQGIMKVAYSATPLKVYYHYQLKYLMFFLGIFENIRIDKRMLKRGKKKYHFFRLVFLPTS